jgi:hypothetical protein
VSDQQHVLALGVTADDARQLDVLVIEIFVARFGIEARGDTGAHRQRLALTEAGQHASERTTREHAGVDHAAANLVATAGLGQATFHHHARHGLLARGLFTLRWPD